MSTKFYQLYTNMKFYYSVKVANTLPSKDAMNDLEKMLKIIDIAASRNDIAFQTLLRNKKPEEIKSFLDEQLMMYQRGFIEHTKKIKPYDLTDDQEIAFEQWIRNITPEKQAIGLTHREFCWLNFFKSKANYEDRIKASDLKGKRREMFYTTVQSKNSKNYKPATKKELQKVIKNLTAFPRAEKAAINILEQLL